MPDRNAAAGGSRRPASAAATPAPGCVEIEYSEDWLPLLEAKLQELGVQDEAERCRLLVTDRLGVEVKLFHRGARGAEPTEDPEADRFPLRVHRFAVAPPQRSPSEPDDQGAAEAAALAKARSPELSFEDVWPGALWAKLGMNGFSVREKDVRWLLITDQSGVQLEVAECLTCVPARARFPLRVLAGQGPPPSDFQGGANVLDAGEGASARRPLRSVSKDFASLVNTRDIFSRSFWPLLLMGRRPQHVPTMEPWEQCRHIVEVAYSDVLQAAVAAKAALMGYTIPDGPAGLGAVLVTNQQGVEVRLDGEIPDPGNFPLKLLIDTARLARKPRPDELQKGDSVLGLPARQVSNAVSAAVAQIARLAR